MSMSFIDSLYRQLPVDQPLTSYFVVYCLSPTALEFVMGEGGRFGIPEKLHKIKKHFRDPKN